MCDKRALNSVEPQCVTPAGVVHVCLTLGGVDHNVPHLQVWTASVHLVHLQAWDIVVPHYLVYPYPTLAVLFKITVFSLIFQAGSTRWTRTCIAYRKMSSTRESTNLRKLAN